jgi:quinol monooxygenase YgiN
MSTPIVIDANAFVSRWFVRAADRDAFIRQFNALWQADIEGLRAATNFVFYGWGRDSNEFVAIESWKSEEIVGAVRKSPGFISAVSDLMRLCDRPMEMQIFAGMNAPHDVLFNTYPAGKSVVHPDVEGVGAIFL